MSKPNPLDNYQNKADEKYSEANDNIKKRAAVILKEELIIINKGVKKPLTDIQINTVGHLKWTMNRRRKYMMNI